MTKAVIYARYSSQKQNECSIEDQIADCKRFAKRKNYSITDIYADHAKSGRNDNREEFQKMLSDSDKHLFDVVIVWKIDRFGRNREEMTLNKLRLKKNGIKVVSAIENIPDTPEGILLESLMEGLAEYYSANLSQNVKRGLKSNAGKTKSNGIQPYGYKSNKDGYIIIDENEAPVVKKVFNLCLAGYSRSEIADFLNKSGIKSRRNKEFSNNTVGHILKNKKMTGCYIYDGYEVEDAFEPIISKQDFQEVQKILADSGFHKRTCPDPYLLSGLLICGKCGAPYIADSGTSKNGHVYHYYKCSNRKANSTNCDNDIVRKEEVENIIKEVTINKVLKNSNIDKLAEDIHQKMGINENEFLPVLEKEKKGYKEKIENLLLALEQGGATDVIVKRINEYQNSIAQLEVEIEREKIKSPNLTVDSIKWALNNFRLSLVNNSQDLFFLFHNFIEKIILNNGIISIYFRFCYKDDKGNIQSWEECSNKLKMVNQPSNKLNTIVFLYNRYFVYSFNYNNLIKKLC